MALDAQQLLQMSQPQLDALFSAHDVGPIPDGEAKGTAIIAPGTSFSGAIAEFINIFAWQGKVFDAKAGLLRNHILVLGLKAIIARVYKAPSLLDGKEFRCGRLVLGCAWRLDVDEFVIRSTGTPEGTHRGVVVFDEDLFSDLVEERLTRSGAQP